MKVSFANVTKENFNFSLEEKDIKFFGFASKLSKNQVKCEAKLQGKTLYLCDRCGEEFYLDIDEDIEVLACDGYSKPSDKIENIVEFFDGFIDFDELFMSELEAIKSDYFYCEKCKQGE